MDLPRCFNSINPLWSSAGFDTGLIVDDMRSSRVVVAEAMRAIGLRVQYAVDGLEAFEKLQSTRISIVVTDIEMPRWTGLDLIAAMRNSPRKDLRELPIVVVSSLLDRRTAESVLQIQGVYFLPKPIPLLELELTLGMIATSQYFRAQNPLLKTALN